MKGWIGRWWVVMLALSLGVNAGLLVRGRGQRGARPDRVERAGPLDLEGILDRHLQRMSASLDLGAEQHAGLESTYAELIPAILERSQRARAARREVGDRYVSPDLDATEFRALVVRLNRAQAELDSLITEVMLREAEFLTAEQRRRYRNEMPWGRVSGSSPGTGGVRDGGGAGGRGPGDRRGPPAGGRPPGGGAPRQGPPPDRGGPPPDGMPPDGGPPSEPPGGAPR